MTGVGTVSVSGAPKREIQVYVDPSKMEAYNLSISAISSIIAAENRNIPSGSIDIGSETYTLRIKKEFTDPSELLDVVLGSYNGGTIYLRDVARITDTVEEKSQESYTNGERGAQIIIQKQSGYNTVQVIEKVKETLANCTTFSSCTPLRVLLSSRTWLLLRIPVPALPLPATPSRWVAATRYSWA